MTLKSTSKVKVKISQTGSIALTIIILVSLSVLLATAWWLPVVEIESQKANSPAPEEFSTTTTKIFEALPEPVKDVLAISNQQLKKLFGPENQITSQEIIADTNVVRRQAGVPNDLTENATLNLVAQKRLYDMFDQQYFEHNSPDGTGASDVAKEVGYVYLNIAENLASGDFATSQEIVQSWMASLGHRANIVNDRFSEIGVAVAKGELQGNKVWLAVQIFGRPQSECQSPNVIDKNKIDQETKILDQLEADANQLLAEIRVYEQSAGLSQNEHNSYQQKVDQYNQLATNINERSQALQALVADYNADVRAYNICIQ